MKRNYSLKEREILDYVQRNHTMTTAEAVALTNASESTVRRIFIKLQKDGRVERVFGGIKEIQEMETYHYHETVITNVEQKREIGGIAAQLVDACGEDEAGRASERGGSDEFNHQFGDSRIPL